jgi:signal transduction histidine kinase
VFDAAERASFEPRVHFDGAIDHMLSNDLAAQVLAVTRELLSNTARHAGATRVDVRLTASDDVMLEVTDDGAGIAAAQTRRSGLANLAQRAESLGGSFAVDSAPGEGTRVTWRVPL